MRLKPWQKNFLICSPFRRIRMLSWLIAGVMLVRNLGLRRNVSDNEFENLATILEILHSWAPTDEHGSLN